MIKKAVLPLLTAPFLMVFSDFSFAGARWHSPVSNSYYQTPASACGPVSSIRAGYPFAGIERVSSTVVKCKVFSDMYDEAVNYGDRVTQSSCSEGESRCVTDPDLLAAIDNNPLATDMVEDEECQSDNGDTYTTNNADTYNYLAAGGSVRTHSGACSVSSPGGVSGCTGSGDSLECTIDIESSSTHELGSYGQNITGGLDSSSDGTFSVIDFNTPEYLAPLPGGCSDPSSCVTIGDTSYLVDWDSAPDYFSYVDSNGTTHSNPSSGGGSGGDNGGGDNGGGNPTDPTDPGGDNGGGDDAGNDDADDGSGGSGGGSTVPDFEFDESGIIEAIGSAGRSNRNAINALSNDVTGAISDQTNDLNAATSAQTDALNSTLNNQTDSLTSSLDDQTDDLTSALEDQTGTITNSLDALGTTFTDALKGLGLGSGDDDAGNGDGDGEGEDGEGDGLLGGISKLLNKMVDKLASRFTEDVGDGDDLFNSSGMDDTLDGVALQEQEHSDEINSLMDQIGEDATSGIAEQVTSRLPSLPSGGCVPLQFGPMEISCQAFNTIKLWLTWIIYFWTVVSIVDTFFRSEQRTA